MKHKNFKAGMLFVLMAGLFSMGANAQSSDENKSKQEPPSTEELLKMMDSNKDGKLSSKEVKGPLKDDFTKIDTNKDGFLTKEELEKAPKPNGKGDKKQESSQDNSEKKEPSTEELIKMMDSNKDGKLSKEEVKGPLEKDFTKVDTNKDGFLTKAELDKVAKKGLESLSAKEKEILDNYSNGL